MRNHSSNISNIDSPIGHDQINQRYNFVFYISIFYNRTLHSLIYYSNDDPARGLVLLQLPTAQNAQQTTPGTTLPLLLPTTRTHSKCHLPSTRKYVQEQIALTL